MTHTTNMKTSQFDYILPEDCIARYPLPERSDSKLLMLNKNTGQISDKQFLDIIDAFNPGDCLVLNDTKVIPARWFGKKQSGGSIECLIERATASAPYPRALVHIKASKAPKPGSDIILEGDITATVMAKANSGLYEVQFNTDATLEMLLAQHAHIPLPPYMEREADAVDETRYQTVFAEHDGAVAAPTAGLHFDAACLQAIQARGVSIAKLTLHIGSGTFLPVRVDDIREHPMHRERYILDETACTLMNQTKAAGGRIIAVGTTVVRTLETVAGAVVADPAAVASAQPLVSLSPQSGESQLFIYPGFRFQWVDAMVTNFHLPRSSLLMLVSAFASRQHILSAYQHAIDNGYRFYSYGDAMLIA